MLSHPPYSQQPQPQPQQQSQDEFGYLSSSLPLPNHQHQRQHHQHQQLPSTGLLTSSYDPHLFDDMCFLDPVDSSSSSSLPLNDHEDWFPFSAHHDDLTGMNIDPSIYHQSMPTIDEVTMSTSSMPPPPPLSQSFSPQSEMSMTSPQTQQPQSQQRQQQQQSQSVNDHLMAPAYKGHRRRRSSSLPSVFYSAKKQIIQSPFVPPLFDTSVNQDNAYSPIQQNIPDYQQQQQQQQQEQQQQQQQPSMVPLDSSSAPSHTTVLQQQQYTKPLPIQIQRNPASNTRQISPITLDQQQLDKKLLKVNFNDVTVAELKDYLRERNLSVAGRKAELADRLYQERQRLEHQQQTQQHQQDNTDTTVAAAEAVAVAAAPSVATRQMPLSASATTSPSSSSSPSVVAQSQLRSTPPPHIQQLTHRLSDLGFQHPPPPPSAFPIYSQQQSNINNTMPLSLPEQQQQQQQLQTTPNATPTTQQQQPFLDYPTQQQLDENNSMSQYYKF